MRKYLAAIIAICAATSAYGSPIIGTVSGVITSSTPDQNGLFGPVGGTLVGDSYAETVVTDPALNSFNSIETPSFHEVYGGNNWSAGTGAPFTLTMTVNGLSYILNEADPFENMFYLNNGLSAGVGAEDQLDETVLSEGCSSMYGPCTKSYVYPWSLTTPFIPTLDFDQSFADENGINSYPQSLMFFYQTGSTVSGSADEFDTNFSGTITSVSLNASTSVSEPPTWAILAGVFGVGFIVRTRRGARSVDRVASCGGA